MSSIYRFKILWSGYSRHSISKEGSRRLCPALASVSTWQTSSSCLLGRGWKVSVCAQLSNKKHLLGEDHVNLCYFYSWKCKLICFQVRLLSVTWSLCLACKIEEWPDNCGQDLLWFPIVLSKTGSFQDTCPIFISRRITFICVDMMMVIIRTHQP